MYTTPPPCSALRCQPMGTCTGTACLSSPASQSFPPFIAPLVLRSTPQRYIYQTSTSVFAMHVMFVFQSRGGGGGGRAQRGRGGGGGWVRDAGLRFNAGLCSRVEPNGVVDEWGGRVGWGELTAGPTLWAASWRRRWTARGLPLLHLVAQSHPTREDAAEAEEERVGSWVCFGRRGGGESFIASCSPFGIPSLSQDEFNILVPKRSWVVVFPWFLWGKNESNQSII